MRLILLGMPAAGKGTQAKLLAERFDVPHISTGSMFRLAIESGTRLGKLARERIENGQLVPDDVTIGIVRQRLEAPDCMERGFILDGFPRTVPQARSLDEILGELGQRLSGVVNIKISENEAVRRIANRCTCVRCGATSTAAAGSRDDRCSECGGELRRRADDNEETAHKRIKVYVSQTRPVVSYYQKANLLVDVPGERSIDVVYTDIVRVFGEGDLRLENSEDVG